MTIAPADEFPNFVQRFLRQIHRVGTHVADQTGGFIADFYAFIQLLRDAHSALRGEAQLARRFLLQGRGGEGRRRVAFALFLLDIDDG